MDDNYSIITLILVVGICVVVGLSLYYQSTETQFEKCLEYCAHPHDVANYDCMTSCHKLFINDTWEVNEDG